MTLARWPISRHCGEIVDSRVRNRPNAFLLLVLLLLSGAACESRADRYSRLRQEQVLAELREQTVRRQADSISRACGGALCPAVTAILDTLRQAEVRASEARRAMRKLEQ
jgi:hypothetical protein